MRVAFAIASTVKVSLQAFGTTAAGTGFMYTSTQTLIFPAGATGAQTLTIPILDNNDATGGTEYFVRPPPNPTSATPAAGATDTLVCIRDNDVSILGPHTGPEPIAELLNEYPLQRYYPD